MFDREPQTGLGRAGATGAESRASEIQNRERDAQTFAERAENIFLRHPHIRASQIGRWRSRESRAFGMRGSSIVNPGMSGVTRNAVIASCPLPGTGVRAMTVSTCAIEALVM